MKNIPVLTVESQSLAETYEKALIKLYDEGIRIKTQYDKESDPKSIDATMNMTILDPLADPMIHKAFPGGINDLREYVYELMGLKDNWIKVLNDSTDTRWEYTYHGRLKNYGLVKLLKNNSVKYTSINTSISNNSSGESSAIDQIEYVIDKLCNQPYSRQAQMITWMPSIDLTCYDPPCLQSLWYRIIEEDGVWWLNSNIRFRSNDAWGANFMNMFGFTMFNKEIIAAEISKRTGKEVKLGRMNWQADSFHIYGKDVEQAEQRLFNRLNQTKFQDRIYNFNDEMIQEMYKECEQDILNKIDLVNRQMT